MNNLDNWNLSICRASVESERLKWHAALAKLPSDRRDVYFSPEYLLPFEASGRGEALCYIFSQGDALFIYPFLKIAILVNDQQCLDKTVYDIESAYGYGGPVVNDAGESKEFLDLAWAQFSRWSHQENIVSEFIRFHPLIKNENWASQKMATCFDRSTIAIELQSYPKELIGSSFYKGHRQMVNRAKRSGFLFEVSELASELDWFPNLYLQTQTHLESSDETKFSDAYFRSLSKCFKEKSWLGILRLNDHVAVAVLVLECELYIHSHLMAYATDLKMHGMINLVLHEISLWGAAHGKQLMHIGGGKTSSDGDSLFKFKKTLSPNLCNFSIGKLCHNENAYERLASYWENSYGPRPNNFLQFYRVTREN